MGENSNIQIISGVLRLNRDRGRARVDFSTHNVSGDANVDTREGRIRGPRRDFRGTPHVIVSPSDLTLSTRRNTFYRITRRPSPGALDIEWRIDDAGLGLEIDFLVIGEPG